MNSFVLANARLVLPGETMCGSLHVRDGAIAAIDSGRAVPDGAEDCRGDLVMPGLIELHTDNLERHIQPRPKVDWPHGAALIAHDTELAGVGITTVFDALRVGSMPAGKARYGKYARQVASELLELRAAGALRISHFLHLRAEICSQTLVEELAEFGPQDRVGIVSMMDHTPGQRQFRDLGKFKTYVTGKTPMNDDDFADHVTRLTEMRARNGVRHEAEAIAAARRLKAALASHDDTTEEQVARSAALGIRLAEFPTTLIAARACRDAGIAVVAGAPNLIRGGSHAGNVAAAELAQAGLLDIVSSDYVPAALLASALLLGDLWGDLARGVRTVTQAPAAAAGLRDRGRLETGARADIIRVSRLPGGAVARATWVGGRRVA